MAMLESAEKGNNGMWNKVTIHGRSGKNGEGIVIMDISVANSDVLSQNAYKIFDKKFILITSKTEIQNLCIADFQQCMCNLP